MNPYVAQEVVSRCALQCKPTAVYPEYLICPEQIFVLESNSQASHRKIDKTALLPRTRIERRVTHRKSSADVQCLDLRASRAQDTMFFLRSCAVFVISSQLFPPEPVPLRAVFMLLESYPFHPSAHIPAAKLEKENGEVKNSSAPPGGTDM